MSAILLVTADKELARVVKAALRNTNARVTAECGTLKAATDEMTKNPPAMAVVDLFLPEFSGLDVIKSLRRANEGCQIVLLTRVRTRTLIERAFRQGAQDVLTYPVSEDILRDTILHRLKSQPLQEAEDAPDAGKPARGRK
jgi:DNA-binding response OmpR family regulator